MSESEVEPVARTVIIEREVHRLTFAGKVAVGALIVAALAGLLATIWGRVGAENRAQAATRLNAEVLSELTHHSQDADCRANALTATSQAQAELMTTIADTLIAFADQSPGTNINQYLGLLRQQAATLEAAIAAQKFALAACGHS